MVINQLYARLTEAFRGLGAAVPPQDVERLAVLISTAMGGPRRAYHTSHHVLQVAAGMNPVQTLAALCHDLAYYQLDEGYPGALGETLGDLIVEDGSGLRLALPPAGREPWGRLCADVFGWADGARLSVFHGANEFASAVVAVRQLAPWLPPATLLAVAACIEATVPFRGVDGTGRSMAEGLWQRVGQAAAQAGITLSEAQHDQIVHDAVGVANQDVAGFAEPDPAVFLGDTWLLIVESNAPLAVEQTYTVGEYRRALGRMHDFLDSLVAEEVFHDFRGFPPPATLAGMTAATRHNVAFACRYLVAKLASAALIEAVAEASGGDCPVSMLLGHVRPRPRPAERLEDYLQRLPVAADVDGLLLDVLALGRSGHGAIPLTRAPFAAYCYRVLGEAGTSAFFETARAYFAGQLSAMEALRASPAALRDTIIRGCAGICLPRRARLIALAESLAA